MVDAPVVFAEGSFRIGDGVAESVALDELGAFESRFTFRPGVGDRAESFRDGLGWVVDRLANSQLHPSLDFGFEGRLARNERFGFAEPLRPRAFARFFGGEFVTELFEPVVA
jgi:hypothetical protein